MSDNDTRFERFPSDAALSPLDGRYRSITQPLTYYLSEEALNRGRIEVEVEWLIYLSELPGVEGPAPLSEEAVTYLREIPSRFDEAMRARLGQFEAQTRHDVKAVEYLVGEEMRAASSPELAAWVQAVHILATSEDVNNLSLVLGVKGAMEEVWIPEARALVDKLTVMAKALRDVPMLARTHGQPATPTTVGKELAVFAHRLSAALKRVETAEYLAKFNGATGTYAAHVIALPEVDWIKASKEFVETWGLTWNPLTTQIESNDWQVRLYADVTHFNRVAHNLATDMWQYISMGYFKQKLSGHGSTGSSTMPHKVNPIRFENAESNLELSNAILESLRDTLATSRMQRDLSDSSTKRNIGVGLGYSLVALSNLVRGLDTVEPNAEVLEGDLASHPEVLAEAIQQALRLGELASPAVPESQQPTRQQPEGSSGPYERLKDATRGKQVSLDDLRALVNSFTEEDLPQSAKGRLSALSPATYTGLAAELVDLLDGDV